MVGVHLGTFSVGIEEELFACFALMSAIAAAFGFLFLLKFGKELLDLWL